jgi:hypothetical protein
MSHEFKALRSMFRAFDGAMKDEQVPPGARRRVLNRLMFGNPDGDVNATVELPDPASVRAALESAGEGMGRLLDLGAEAFQKARCDVALPNVASLKAGDPLMVDGDVYRISRVLTDDGLHFRAQVRPETEEPERG